MTLYVYNTLVREKQEFIPLHPGRVHMYVCGPTVYNDSHLGHGKTYINFDTVVRYLRYLGYQVVYVQNITDVGHLLDSGEDRMLKGALREHKHPMAIAETYTQRYFSDMDRLNVLRPDISPRATGHVPEMIEMIETLIEKGYAYEMNGSVYFSVRSDPDYGKLSGRHVDNMMSGTRVETRDEKRDPEDFALWKKAEPEHIMRWKSPWGEGFPGWHIECSAMSSKYLGLPFDIHGGGVENKFPHHECEIAQAECATGKDFARYWLHNGMLMIRGEEMHKSLGNYVTLEKAFERWDPMVIRFFVLQSHYRGPIDLTEDAIEAAGKGLDRLLKSVGAVRKAMADAPEGAASDAVLEMLIATRAEFERSMDDDFNTAGATAALFELSRQVNVLFAESDTVTQSSLQEIDNLFTLLLENVLGIRLDNLKDNSLGESLASGLMDLLIETRAALRQERQWAMSDKIRDGLDSLGVELGDGPEGTTWSIR